MQINIGAAQNRLSEKILVVTIDVKVSFQKRIKKIYAKVRETLYDK